MDNIGTGHWIFAGLFGLAWWAPTSWVSY
ncbi:MAG: hypothetical protein RL276_1456, partial [Bacteroidota bacterium]